MSEREYAAQAGLSRGAIQKAKSSGRVVLHADGSIDAAANDARRAAATNPSKSRAAPKERMKPVPNTAVSAVGETLREHGLAAPTTGSGMSFLQTKTANEVLKAQERKLRLAKLKGDVSRRKGRRLTSNRGSARAAARRRRGGSGSVSASRHQRRTLHRERRSPKLLAPLDVTITRKL